VYPNQIPVRPALALARLLILALWLIWVLYWILVARSGKRVRRREPVVWRVAFLAQMLLTAVLLGPHKWTGWLGTH
jgi:hypothetical protein